MRVPAAGPKPLKALPRSDIGGSRHGSIAGYARKCRCDRCRVAWREYKRQLDGRAVATRVRERTS